MNETLTAIANLYDRLYQEIVDVVRKHQGLINTSNDGDKCTIYIPWYDFYSDSIEEIELRGLRLVNDKLQILTFVGPKYDYFEEWNEISPADTVYYFQILFNIADNIEEYL